MMAGSARSSSTCTRKVRRCAFINNFAIAVSLGLQYGGAARGICRRLHLHPLSSPAGPVQGNDSIKYSTSILDYVFRELAVSYLERFDLAMSIRPSRASTARKGVQGRQATGATQFVVEGAHPLAHRQARVMPGGGGREGSREASEGGGRA